MLEKIKRINNPLTIIAIFAALAEAAGTVALALVDKELQHIFIWFVIGFPILLVVLFFLTLNFNTKVLYAPSDFEKDENYLKMLAGNKEIEISLELIKNQLDDATTQIVNQAVNQISSAGDSERIKLSEIIDRQLESIKTQIETTRQTAERYVSNHVSSTKDFGSVLLETVAGPKVINKGDAATYVIKVTNHKSTSVNNLKINASFDGNAKPINSTNGMIDGNSVSLPLVPVLPPRQAVTYRIIIKGVAVGDAHSRISLICDELPSAFLELDSIKVR